MNSTNTNTENVLGSARFDVADKQSLADLFARHGAAAAAALAAQVASGETEAFVDMADEHFGNVEWSASVRHGRVEDASVIGLGGSIHAVFAVWTRSSTGEIPEFVQIVEAGLPA